VKDDAKIGMWKINVKEVYFMPQGFPFPWPLSPDNANKKQKKMDKNENRYMVCILPNLVKQKTSFQGWYR
jgi:hypothetical protein